MNKIRELLTFLLWVCLFPFIQSLLNRHQKDHHKHRLLYSIFPKFDFLLSNNSVLRSFSSFINWGFYPSENKPSFNDFVINLPAAQQKFPYGAYHYYRLLKKQVLHDRSILEVGCGNGSGCAYVIEPLFSPQCYVGLDISPRFIKICKKRKLEERYSFTTGSALELPFASNSFDIVLNIESSHCYASFKKFLREVERVLRPGGLFIFADLRWGVPNQIENILKKQLSSTNLELINFHDISKNIIAARQLVSQHITLVDRLVFQYNPTLATHFGLKGSTTFEMLQNGTIGYFEALLQKTKLSG